MAASELRQAMTDPATQLAGLATIVEVEELRGCAAVSTTTGRRHRAGTATPPNRRQWTTVVALILSTQWLPVQSRRGRRDSGRCLGQGSQGIDGEIAVVRMLLAKVVAGLRLGLTPGENLFQFVDQLLQFLAGKFPAEPKHQAWYLAHGGDSLSGTGGFLEGGLGKRESTAFFVCRQVPQELHPQARVGQAVLPPKATPAHRARKGEKTETPASPRNSRDYRLKEGKSLAVPQSQGGDCAGYCYMSRGRFL